MIVIASIVHSLILPAEELCWLFLSYLLMP